MTSNFGADMIQERFAEITDENAFELIEQTKEDLFDNLKRFVRPEFLNRIDEVVMFSPLTRRDMRKVVTIQFAVIQEQLEDMGIKLLADKKVLNTLAEMGYDTQLGARPLKRVMQKRILNELSKELLAGTIQRDSTIRVVLDEFDRISFVNEAETNLLN
jgi:ATP-dependent Clp protease ATP-binding subunit ClpB